MSSSTNNCSYVLLLASLTIPCNIDSTFVVSTSIFRCNKFIPELSIKRGRTCDYGRIMTRLDEKVLSSFLLVMVINKVIVLSSFSMLHGLLNRIICEASEMFAAFKIVAKLDLFWPFPSVSLVVLNMLYLKSPSKLSSKWTLLVLQRLCYALISCSLFQDGEISFATCAQLCCASSFHMFLLA